jgi:16S rRNA (cytosine1402-N4)-methyltransferase
MAKQQHHRRKRYKGTHPRTFQEKYNILHITPGETGLDATLGYGGHSLEMLKCLDHKGHLYALDVDPRKTSLK